MRNFVKEACYHGGQISPLIIPAIKTDGMGLMNPSIMNDDGIIRGVLRNVNYIFYHSEKHLFQHPYGKLTYVHPEDDINLKTRNWYFELDDNLKIKSYNLINTDKFDNYEPKWEFHGLEDARIVRWDGDLYITGVRRDTTDNGQGRMELSKIKLDKNVKEVRRYRIEHPTNPDEYLEKNWMPILDKPWHFVRFSNPTEIVKVDIKTCTSEFVHVSDKVLNLKQQIRGGSQLIKINNNYLAVTHECDFYHDETGRKDSEYEHRFLLWDENFELIKISEPFHFMDGQVEFCVGMCRVNRDLLITFGFQDNAAFVLKTPLDLVMDMLHEVP